MLSVKTVVEAVQPHLVKWYTILFATVLLYIVHRQIQIYKITRKYKCQDVKYVRVGFLGISALRQLLTALATGRLLEFFQKALKETSDQNTVALYLAGVRLVFTLEPENMKAILATQFNDFALGSRHTHFLPLLGDGIFTLDSHGWKNSRAMLRPQFSREQIAHVKTLEPHLQTLASHIRKADGGVFDIQDLFFKYTVDTATDVLFGESVYCLRDGTVDELPPHDEFEGRAEFGEAFNVAQRYLAKRSYSQSFYFLVNPPAFRESCRKVHAFARYYVDKALSLNDEEIEKKSQKGYTFLYELVKQTRNPKVLQDQLLNIMVAGRDTTAGLLSFTLFELSRNPDVFNKLKEEIYTQFGHGSQEDISGITFESLKKCEYLKWVLNEILRLYPAVPINFRDATKDTVLPTGGGPDGKSPVFIGKGTTVIYSVYCTQRMEEYYGKDANEFKPERWAENRKLGWAYLPFNGGPRICLGQQFALTEASYTIVRLIQMFPTLTSAYKGEQSPEKMLHLTMSMFDGVPVTWK
uniref:CYP52A59 n=1 Tax=Danielia oregonensis TaxID=46584 RepID=A0A1B3B2M3_9ASCO|nr:CYP52A59 [[Candida] oregonensis]